MLIFFEQLTLNQRVTGSNPVSPIQNSSILPQKGDFSQRSQQGDAQHVRSMFSASENDADLKLLLERWPELSVELRQAIVKIVR